MVIAPPGRGDEEAVAVLKKTDGDGNLGGEPEPLCGDVSRDRGGEGVALVEMLSSEFESPFSMPCWL